MLKEEHAYEQKKNSLNQRKKKKSSKSKHRLVRYFAKNKLVYLLVTVAAVFAIFYICFAGYYWDKFLSGTYINGVEVSGMTTKEAEQKVRKIEMGKITLVGRNQEKNEINLNDLKAKVVIGDKVNKVKNEQNPLLWLGGYIGKNENDVQTTISYQTSNLESYIDRLSMVSGSDRVKPKDACVVFDKTNGYEIQKEVLGNTIDKDKLLDAVVKALKNKEHMIDLEKAKCYVQPKHLVADSDYKALASKLDMIKKVAINYADGQNKKAADYSVIKDWINIDSNLNLTLKEDKVNNFVQNVAYKFNTLGKIRNFKTASGSVIRIGGGNYGNRINYSQEVANVKNAILSGKNIDRAPKYVQKARVQGENDIGNTYIEVSISAQTLYYFENGKRILSTPVVTGKVAAGHSTPRGVCQVLSKERNRWLRGPGYASYVRYWMQINGGVGIHDSSWRHSYGGTRYIRGGSHGCINTPFAQVVEVFNRVSVGTPVIVY
ncbi:ErfK/YbiS/YcfS/YnhG family protein [Lachnospiraceae bacterium KM106-2]|nr:ErfK/YbiS/YcfS/YnhG family protein [Lachnospiraceae bacterium KM106-2]